MARGSRRIDQKKVVPERVTTFFTWSPGLAAPGAITLATGDDEFTRSGIETIEGMAQGDKLHPLQQKFLEHAALQCGICTPGFLVASKALLAKNPNPTETEVRFWLAGNLCRCTGYDKIISAVLDVAAEMRAAK